MAVYTPSGFGASSIIPISKKHNNVADSNNFPGIALIARSVFLYFFLIIVVLEKFHANLYTSDLQFGFKFRHSTSIWSSKRPLYLLCYK